MGDPNFKPEREKLGVVVTKPEEGVKTGAADVCPRCGKPVDRSGNVPKCPQCGTEPFEG
jgi:rubrerythrin